MSEDRAPYSTKPPILIAEGTPEARLLELYRRLRQERGSNRRWMFIAVTPDGGSMILRGEPAGVVTDN